MIKTSLRMDFILGLTGTDLYTNGDKMSRTEAARRRAKEDARAPTPSEADGRQRTTRVAIGDPQAPIDVFMKILDEHDLLGEDGRLKPEVALTSMGDHFDWGGANESKRASVEGLEILAWLAAHPRDQVTILVGNHDLARVGELARFDDATFARAQAEALPAYAQKDPELEKRFVAHFPDLASSELAARDFSAFAVAQRELVVMLLRDRRLRIAQAVARNFMLSHAGVTIDDLDAVHLPQKRRADATEIAYALNAILDAAVDRWDGSPMRIEGLHRPGDAANGEGRGIFFHRPVHHDGPSEAPKTQLQRRYDPRRLPLELTQAIGHVRDGKCRSLLGEWADGEPSIDGLLRVLRTDGERVTYARLRSEKPSASSTLSSKMATLLFTDGGMSYARPGEYQLLDLDSRGAFGSVPPRQ
jgi:hypothetical protein